MTVEGMKEIQQESTQVKKPLVQEDASVESVPVVEDQPLLQTATELIAQGTQALALSLYEDAAERLALAVEMQVNVLGQYALEVAPTFHLYGKALLGAAVAKNSVLGEKADQVKPADLSTVAPGGQPSENFVFEGDEEEEEEEQVVEEDEEAKNLEDIEIPMGDDLELAWENLDVARLIFSKSQDADSQLQLADVHLTLGDVSLESENFDEAIKDYETALKLKMEFGPSNYRELAEAHFKLGLAFEYSELSEEAIEQVGSAMNAIKKRIDLLVAKDTGKGKQPAEQGSSGDAVEISELTGFLSELDSKLSDLKLLLEKEQEGESIAAAPVTNPATAPQPSVNDISGLVKKRKPTAQPAPSEQEESKKSKLE